MKEPRIADYNLTEKVIENLKKKDAGTKKVLFVVPVILAIAYSVYQAVNDTGSLRLAVYVIPFYVFLGVVGGAILGGILIGIYSSVATYIYPDLANLRKYEEAKTRYEEPIIRQKINFWRGLKDEEVLHELARLFEKNGYNVSHTPSPENKGIDLILEKEGKTKIVQCVIQEKPVEQGAAGELYNTLLSSGADEAILVSLSGFTRGVRKYVQSKQVTLMDLPDIILMQGE